MTRPKYSIFFDLDGTIINPTIGITHSVAYAVEAMGRTRPDPESLIWCIGPSLRLTFATLLETDQKDLIEEAVSHYRTRFASDGVSEFTLYPDAIETILRLADRYQLFICTAKYEKFAKIIIDSLNITHLFHTVHGDDANGRFTDKGLLVTHMLATHGLDKKDCIMIGDRLNDIKAAYDNDMASLHIGHGFAQTGEFDEYPPTYRSDGFLTLEKVLDENWARSMPSP